MVFLHVYFYIYLYIYMYCVIEDKHTAKIFACLGVKCDNLKKQIEA